MFLEIRDDAVAQREVEPVRLPRVLDARVPPVLAAHLLRALRRIDLVLRQHFPRRVAVVYGQREFEAHAL